MSTEVWAVWPTIALKQTRAMINCWHDRGYKVAVLLNTPHTHDDLPNAERVIVQTYWQGFPTAANILCKETPGDVVVVVGDDVYPDPDKTAKEIGEQFRETFPDLFGVMQPIGDKFAHTDQCAVSPWIGRGFIEKAYGGKGPYWGEYFHYFSDQELQEYASQLNAFQQREDVTQYHDHWQRKDNPRRPAHLFVAKRKWRDDKKLFETRKKKGFPYGND